MAKAAMGRAAVLEEDKWQNILWYDLSVTVMILLRLFKWLQALNPKFILKVLGSEKNKFMKAEMKCPTLKNNI